MSDRNDTYAWLKSLVLAQITYFRRAFTLGELCTVCGVASRGQRAVVRNVLYRLHDAGIVVLVQHDGTGNRWKLRWIR